MYVVAVVVAGFDNLCVGFEDGGFLGEFAFEHAERAFERTVKEPADESEGKDIAAFEYALVVEPGVRESGLGHRGGGHFNYLSLDVEFLEGIEGLEKCFLDLLP